MPGSKQFGAITSLCREDISGSAGRAGNLYLGWSHQLITAHNAVVASGRFPQPLLRRQVGPLGPGSLPHLRPAAVVVAGRFPLYEYATLLVHSKVGTSGLRRVEASQTI
ncbi:hypothetical protein NPX13_g6944 [Xylaria arbuscula]|uniref:Uncharacterized protein n=1 Tax=Xylaria arbuscula TaxID=114810 RepID=A0A9W8NBM4_9PEZI|nr:hypothetical protein NPX13_g6944 [Xylaria arbuscula]